MTLINKNFKYLFFSRLSSNAGDSIYSIALVWFVYQQTKSSFWTGVLATALALPDLFLFLFGPLIDRLKPKYLLILLELIQMILSIILVIVALGNDLNIIGIILVAFLISLASGFVYPTQENLINKIVDTKALSSAASYMSFAGRGVDYLFNAIAGFLLTVFSFTNIVGFNTVTFGLSILFLCKLSLKDQVGIQSDFQQENIHESKYSMLDNVKFLFSNPVIFRMLVLASMMNFMFGGLTVYQPILGDNLGGAYYYGWLQALGSLGILVGTTILAKVIVPKIGEGKTLILAPFLIGIGFVMTSFATNYSSLGTLVLWTFSFMFLGLSQLVEEPILQVILPQVRFGRLITLFYSVSAILLPVGSFVWGMLGGFVDYRMFIIIFGTVSILSGFLMVNRKISQFKIV